MTYTHEELIKIDENLTIQYLENEHIANVFFYLEDKLVLSKSAELLSFRGLLNLIAFFSHTSNYTICEEGIVLYANIIELNHMYLELEDTLEYYDEQKDEILKDFDNGYQLTLYYRSHNEDDIEIASFDLDDLVIDLFAEITDFTHNELYKEKMNGQVSTLKY